MDTGSDLVFEAGGNTGSKKDIRASLSLPIHCIMAEEFLRDMISCSSCESSMPCSVTACVVKDLANPNESLQIKHMSTGFVGTEVTSPECKFTTGALSVVCVLAAPLSSLFSLSSFLPERRSYTRNECMMGSSLCGRFSAGTILNQLL